MSNGKKGFDAEKWKRGNTAPGGGIVKGARGMRYDDHSDTARKLMEIEKRRQSEKENSTGGSGLSKG